MKPSMIVKINFLVLGLGLTIWVMYNLNHNGLSPSLRSLFGLSNSGTSSQQVRADERKWNWCETRVTSMIQPERFKITQEGSNWIRENGGTKALDFIAVEKWLSKFCSVLVTPTKAVVDDSFSVAFLVKFVDNKVEVVRRNPQGTYYWNGQTFTSPAFDAALAELDQIPSK